MMVPVIENNGFDANTTTGPELFGGVGFLRQLNLNIVNDSQTHSIPDFDASTNLNSLYNNVEIIVGKRAASLFGYGVSAAVESSRCAAFISSYFVSAGEDPDRIALNGAEDDLLNFGEAIAKNNGRGTYDLFEDLSPYYTNNELTTLVTFAGQIIAAGVFYNVWDSD